MVETPIDVDGEEYDGMIYDPYPGGMVEEIPFTPSLPSVPSLPAGPGMPM